MLDSLVRAVRDALPEATAIYMFGSRASGDEGPQSDVDLAVLSPRAMRPEERWELQERLAAIAHADVDLVDLRTASTVMRVQVVDGGRVLYDGDTTARAHFEATALGAYARLQEERAGILADIGSRGRVYG